MDSTVSTSTTPWIRRLFSVEYRTASGKMAVGPGADPRVLLRAGVDPDLEATLVAPGQQTNDAVVLELLPDRPDQNRAHVPPQRFPAQKTAQYYNNDS